MTRQDGLDVIVAAVADWKKGLVYRDWSTQDVLNAHRGLSVWRDPYALIFEDWAIVVKDRRSSKGVQVSYHEALAGALIG